MVKPTFIIVQIIANTLLHIYLGFCNVTPEGGRWLRIILQIELKCVNSDEQLLYVLEHV